MDLDRNEKLLSEFLEDRQFKCIRFSDDEIGRGPTPDFRVYKGDEFCFYCEVKSVDEDRWLDKELSCVPPGTIAGGARPDPIFNRLVSDIHQAVKQFNAVNFNVKNPNVLAFVNHDSVCGIHDLFGVFTGDFLGEEGAKDPIYKKYSEGRIKYEKLRIHMFLWINAFGGHHFMFTGTDQTHHENICKWFEKKPSAIKLY